MHRHYPSPLPRLVHGQRVGRPRHHYCLDDRRLHCDAVRTTPLQSTRSALEEDGFAVRQAEVDRLLLAVGSEALGSAAIQGGSL